MIDVNKITSTLAKLPDAQLQQYAQMHKSDPYIMALAMSEANRRKELRSASQAQPAQEQPKVVDQEIASMVEQSLPEEQGIGQIPVGNMDFAGGGIVAFADGGDVERYQFGGDTTFDPFGAPVFRQADQVDQDEPTFRERLGLGNRENRRVLEQVERDAAARRAPPKPIVEPTAAPAAAPAAEEKPAPRVNAPAAAAARDEDAPARTGGLSSIDALQKKYFGGFEEKQGEFKGMREGLVQGIKDLTAANLADIEAENAARSSDVVYKDREARLAKQGKDIEGMGDKYLGLALLQAGAAMMSTPGGIAAAIGKGVAVGADRYVAGLEKINAAQSKFAEARDRLDELRLNRDDMSAKEIRAAKREYKAADLKGQELLLSAAEKDWGIERDMLGKVFTAANEDLQTTRRIQAQRATANKQDANERMRAAVLADLQTKYPNDPTKVAVEFNKTLAKSAADPLAVYNQELAKAIAEEEVKMAKMGDAVLPGQAAKLQSLKNQLAGSGGNQVKVASRADVAATARSSGKTEQQVIEALKARGYTIQ